MATIRTHYDNLKVARDAPLEVIRAAYKSLAQRYHPDRNPDDKESERIMQLINASYDVLSNSERRKDHDDWIHEQEEAEKNRLSPQKSYEYATETMSPFAKQNTPYSKEYGAPPNVPPAVRNFAIHFLRFRPIYSLLVGFYIIWTIYTAFTEVKSQFNTTRPTPDLLTAANTTFQEALPHESPRADTQPAPSTIGNAVERFDLMAKLQMLQIEVARARQTGMNDDLIYLQLVQSSKLKSTIASLKSKGLSEDMLINRLKLDISAPPNILRGNSNTLIANNFFDSSVQNISKPDPYSTILSALTASPNSVLQEKITPPAPVSKSTSPNIHQLTSLLSLNEITPTKAQGKISYLRSSGLSDNQIYNLLITNSPFSSRIEKAKSEGFNDNDIAQAFGLTLKS